MLVGSVVVAFSVELCRVLALSELLSDVGVAVVAANVSVEVRVSVVVCCSVLMLSTVDTSTVLSLSLIFSEVRLGVAP